MITRLQQSLRFRKKWSEIGVRFLRSRNMSLDRLTVAGRRVQLSLPESERRVLHYELGKIYFDDCYYLNRTAAAPNILDIGANVGLFSLVARHRFPTAAIHCYETNPEILGHLRRNVGPLGVEVFPEAVGARDGWTSLAPQGGSLHTTTRDDPNGRIPVTSFDCAVERLGGCVDLLKLDCEGAEWSILENSVAIDRVSTIVMEFHLWAREGTSIDDLVRVLDTRMFTVTDINHDEHKSWGMLRAVRMEASDRAFREPQATTKP